MALERCTDLAPTGWLLGSGTDPWQLLTFGPDVFEASARLRFIPDPTAVGQQEGDVVEPEGYALFVGDVAALEAEASLLAGRGMLPAMIWPQDRAWCVASDVDPHWAGIGGSAAAIRAVVDDPRLDAVPADPRADQPCYFGVARP